MKGRNLTKLALGTALAILAFVAAPEAGAVGTQAGEIISNIATVDFEDVNGNTLTMDSNEVTTTVSSVFGVDIDPAALAQNANPGDLTCYAHTVTNNGNDTDTIDVDASSDLGWTVTVYEDVNSNGVYDSGTDIALTDTNANTTPDTDTMADNATMEILVCVSVPAGTADTIEDTTDVDVISGADTNETDAAVDTTTIEAPNLSVVKQVSPAGDQPPGTVLTYTVTITNNGAGNAANMVLTDPIPTFTTYEAGTITLNGAAQTDGADSPTDESDYNVTNPGEITVGIGTLAPTGVAVIVFDVQID